MKYVGSRHGVSAEIAVAMAVPIENPAVSEMLFVNCRTRSWVILPKRQTLVGIVLLYDSARLHTARQTQALLREQFHWDISEHPPYSTDLAPSDFFLFPNMEHLAGKLFVNDEDLKDAVWITRRPHGMKRVYTNWCQGTTGALMSKVTMWESRQRYVGLSSVSIRTFWEFWIIEHQMILYMYDLR